MSTNSSSKRGLQMWKQVVTVLLLLCTAFAHAGTPSYIGPWVYRASAPLPYGEIYGQTSEEVYTRVVAIWNIIYVGTPFEKTFCNYRMGGIYNWSDTNASPTVEGVEVSASQYYQLDYDLECPNGNGRTGVMLREMARNRLVCASDQRYIDGQCVTGYLERSGPGAKGDDKGPPPCDCPDAGKTKHTGQPINPSTGNMWHVDKDYRTAAGSSALEISRTYNSAPFLSDGLTKRSFGVRWSHAYDAVLSHTLMLPEYLETWCWVWRNGYKKRCGTLLVPKSPIPSAVKIFRGDGKSYVFHSENNVWVGDADTKDRVTPIYNADRTAIDGWTYLAAVAGNTETFDANGRLLSIVAHKGSTQQLTYSDGLSNDTGVGRYPANAPVCALVQDGAILEANRLLCVTDNFGRQIQFKYDLAGRIVEAIDPDNVATLYEYDGPSGGCLASAPNSVACKANNLTKVTYPDGKSRTYVYNERSRINSGGECPINEPLSATSGHLPTSMTGLIDENEARHINWTYDCNGRATSSELAGSVERVRLEFAADGAGAMSTQVKHYLGDPAAPEITTRTLQAVPILGAMKTTSVSGPCVECGTYALRTYDVNGNPDTATDFNGVKTKFSFDLLRNLEINRIEALGTPQARTITTAWHPVHRLRTSIAEPKRLTTNTYDPAGNLLVRTEQTTNDLTGTSGFAAVVTGAPRSWKYLYNATGKILRVTGPRTDVVDQTDYAYDTYGNLASVTNALGQATTYSNYDASGRVGQIIEPNGSTMNLSYTARGWLSRRSVTAAGVTENTDYEYDGVGQVTRVTMPDLSWIAYAYDAAHRLTGVNDNSGNSVSYTLDLTGNRLREKTNDPGGVLRRQVTRVFDTMNRVRQQTGGTQ